LTATYKLAGLTVIVVEVADVLNIGMIDINRMNNTDSVTYFFIVIVLSPSNLHLSKGLVAYLRFQEHTSIPNPHEKDSSAMGATAEVEVEELNSLRRQQKFWQNLSLTSRIVLNTRST
jgi:hypothetical protein